MSRVLTDIHVIGQVSTCTVLSTLGITSLRPKCINKIVTKMIVPSLEAYNDLLPGNSKFTKNIKYFSRNRTGNEDFCMFMDFSCDFPKDQPKQTR